jgi:hypothetical protein
VRRLILTALLLCLTAAPAAAFLKPVTLMADLDGDSDLEEVEAYRIDVEGAEDRFDQTGIRVKDTCGGQLVSRKIAGPQDNLVFMRLKPLDTRNGSEVFLDMRSGASGRLGEARVVAWRKDVSGCRRARSLFTYKSDRPTRSPSGATREVSFFNLRAKALSTRFRGTELRLVEQFLKRGEPGCCGSIRKTTLWRYSRPKDRYVRYRTSVRRNARG